MSDQPARASMSSTRAGSAKANGPGASAGGGGGGLGRRRATSAKAGFSSHARKQENSRLAPGAARPRKLAKAATGSAKNITPWRETRRSGAKSPVGRQTAASATSNERAG